MLISPYTIFRYLMVFGVLCLPLCKSYTQENNQMKDDVIQLFGEVSGKGQLSDAIPLELVTVKVRGKDRATFTTAKGTFSIVSNVGDTLEFSHVGYKTAYFVVSSSVHPDIPFSYVSVKLQQINYDLPEFKVRSLPTRAQFERDFVNSSVEQDMVNIASSNLAAEKINNLMLTTPVDGGEAVNYTIMKNEYLNTYYGQQVTSQLFNPLAWAQFLNALKSGSFKLTNKKK